jgi:hypothetical protein
MTVGIVDTLEPVQVSKENPERNAVFGMSFELPVKLPVQIVTVCHLGCWIQERQLCEFRGFFSHSPLPGVIIEDLYRSYEFAVFVPNRGDTNLRGDSGAAFMVKIDFRFVRAPVCQGTTERTDSFTEQIPGVINVHQDISRAILPHHFLRTESSKSFRAFVPIRNPSLQIGEVDTVMKVVEDHFEEDIHFVRRRVCRKRPRRLHSLPP